MYRPLYTRDGSIQLLPSTVVDNVFFWSTAVTYAIRVIAKVRCIQHALTLLITHRAHSISSFWFVRIDA